MEYSDSDFKIILNISTVLVTINVDRNLGAIQNSQMDSRTENQHDSNYRWAHRKNIRSSYRRLEHHNCLTLELNRHV